jgi:hypothetical protein
MPETIVMIQVSKTSGVEVQRFTLHPFKTWSRAGELVPSKTRFAWFHNMPARANYGSDPIDGIDEAIAYLEKSWGYTRQEKTDAQLS